MTDNCLMQVISIADAPVEHSVVLLTCTKLPHGFKKFSLFLSGCLRQVSLYMPINKQLILKKIICKPLIQL